VPSTTTRCSNVAHAVSATATRSPSTATAPADHDPGAHCRSPRSAISPETTAGGSPQWALTAAMSIEVDTESKLSDVTVPT